MYLPLCPCKFILGCLKNVMNPAILRQPFFIAANIEGR